MSNLGAKRRVALTGGGTAGHVIPHFALLPEFNRLGVSYFYIGSNGIERELAAARQMKFYTIQSGKLRRYFSWQNFTDIFRIFIGFVQSLIILMKDRPDVLFSKGGFVSVPVCYAAALLRIRIVTHESDLSPGLATRMIAPVAATVCCTFPETLKLLPAAKGRYLGAIVRADILEGDRNRGLSLAGFSGEDTRPIVLFIGGSLGAQKINECLAASFAELKLQFRVIHLCGRGKSIGLVDPDYCSFEFVGQELADLYACSDFVVSRAGANSIFETLTLCKPMLLIPLQAGSRGDQVDNAASFVKKGWASQLLESALTPAALISALSQLRMSAHAIITEQRRVNGNTAISALISLLLDKADI